uniref:Uncharacterized protein n=1 Tax=Schistocephalus solidus TaxID=70667 RepID=A0A0V0J823_SCHSO
MSYLNLSCDGNPYDRFHLIYFLSKRVTNQHDPLQLVGDSPHCDVKSVAPDCTLVLQSFAVPRSFLFFSFTSGERKRDDFVLLLLLSRASHLGQQSVHTRLFVSYG